METTMTNLKQLSAAALMVATLPLAAASPSLAQTTLAQSFAAGRGPGPCTPAAGVAVGAAGPAMNGGQLMAGVGQCGQVSSHQPYGYWGQSYGYNSYGYDGYGDRGLRTPAYGEDY
jgi:hypothetical protein